MRKVLNKINGLGAFVYIVVYNNNLRLVNVIRKQ